MSPGTSWSLGTGGIRTRFDVRNNTDPDDAYLLARYLAGEADQLRRFKPRSRQEQQLWSLIKRRGAVVQTRQQLQQSLNGAGVPAKSVFRELGRLIERLEQHRKALVRALGWWADYTRCLSIPGIGPANAVALIGLLPTPSRQGAPRSRRQHHPRP